MDFKVAGTAKGVTALQMDIKINGITEEIMEIATGRATEARLNILGQMNQIIAQSRSELSANAPTMIAMKIDTDKIRDVIGKGGATIRAICEETKASIDIEDDGSIKIFGETKEAADAAKQRILGHHRRGRDRQDLRRQGRAHRRLRCLRQHPAWQGRPGAHLHAERCSR